MPHHCPHGSELRHWCRDVSVVHAGGLQPQNHRALVQSASQSDCIGSSISAAPHYVQLRINSTDQWVDCEADEVTVKKRCAGNNETLWTEYLGIVRRGAPATLVLLELETVRRAPGPGPLRREECLKIGAQWIAGQSVVLHSDSAKAKWSHFFQM
eukprot:6464622-Amphidinium_carterae.1